MVVVKDKLEVIIEMDNNKKENETCEEKQINSNVYDIEEANNLKNTEINKEFRQNIASDKYYGNEVNNVDSELMEVSLKDINNYQSESIKQVKEKMAIKDLSKDDVLSEQPQNISTLLQTGNILLSGDREALKDLKLTHTIPNIIDDHYEILFPPMKRYDSIDTQVFLLKKMNTLSVYSIISS